MCLVVRQLCGGGLLAPRRARQVIGTLFRVKFPTDFHDLNQNQNLSLRLISLPCAKVRNNAFHAAMLVGAGRMRAGPLAMPEQIPRGGGLGRLATELRL